MIKYVAVLQNKIYPGHTFLYEFESSGFPTMLEVIRYAVIQYQKSVGVEPSSVIGGYTSEDLYHKVVGIFEKENYERIKSLL